jgi:hypothetical protein
LMSVAGKQTGKGRAPTSRAVNGYPHSYLQCLNFYIIRPIRAKFLFITVK